MMMTLRHVGCRKGPIQTVKIHEKKENKNKTILRSIMANKR